MWFNSYLIKLAMSPADLTMAMRRLKMFPEIAGANTARQAMKSVTKFHAPQTPMEQGRIYDEMMTRVMKPHEQAGLNHMAAVSNAQGRKAPIPGFQMSPAPQAMMQEMAKGVSSTIAPSAEFMQGQGGLASKLVRPTNLRPLPYPAKPRPLHVIDDSPIPGAGLLRRVLPNTETGIIQPPTEVGFKRASFELETLRVAKNVKCLYH